MPNTAPLRQPEVRKSMGANVSVRIAVNGIRERDESSGIFSLFYFR
ncbi:hypothetical protein EBBID32_16330 [Sphingobium indicum BiD32]|uniref:Uncharacterized protein n=1 Tax=Sphingobium indicum BiD32 TaxID=1301087 RepID=N1MKN5_9SPHN|nr:hypothetical protein EBBID32_16330 [Sphingobium indicum BiD32]